MDPEPDDSAAIGDAIASAVHRAITGAHIDLHDALTAASDRCPYCSLRCAYPDCDLVSHADSDDPTADTDY